MINVLVVDDQSYARKFIQTIFKRHFDYVIMFEASNGREALEQISSENIDLILLDVSMPIMSGREFLKELRGMQNNTKVVMMTANANKELIEELINLGVTDYFLKPLDYKNILERFGKLFVDNFAEKISSVAAEVEE